MSPDAKGSSKSGNLKDSARFGEMDHGRSELVEVMVPFNKRIKRRIVFLFAFVGCHLYFCFILRRQL